MKWKKWFGEWTLSTRFFTLKIRKGRGVWHGYIPWTGWMEFPGSMTLGEVMGAVQRQMACELKMTAGLLCKQPEMGVAS